MLAETPYSFKTRFENEKGTNPEELIAAAHAGCFSMALSGGLTKEGFAPKKVTTRADVHIGPDPAGGFRISRIELFTDAEVPGIDQAKFDTVVEATRTGCPVSKLLGKGAEIAVKATLKS